MNYEINKRDDKFRKDYYYAPNTIMKFEMQTNICNIQCFSHPVRITDNLLNSARLPVPNIFSFEVKIAYENTGKGAFTT